MMRRMYPCGCSVLVRSGGTDVGLAIVGDCDVHSVCGQGCRCCLLAIWAGEGLNYIV